jgi:cytochrome c oxidase accessory protein FixG
VIPQPIIQERVPIFPRSVQGRYRTLKYAILIFAYGVYFSLPWLPWQRAHGPSQTILFDIINRRFYIFDLVVYAQDIFWLAGLLIIAGLLLFFVTGIAGRVFCGYFCFQTLWTDVFMFIERMVQGERNARIKLACAPWSVNKITRMSMTWLLWLCVAFWTAFSFVLYWGESKELFIAFFTGAAPFPAYATTLFLTLSTFVMAGIAREQVCTYMCPYARFQAVMFDEHTLVVAYDRQRGEGTAGRHKPEKELLTQTARAAKGVGDCIDCGYCVQVCPVGIDIRDGLQYQCITCALCIDACNNIMDTAGFPRGLIRYTAQAPISGKKPTWLRAKTLGYGLVLILASGGLIWSVMSRTPVEMQLEQVRQPLYVVLSDGRIVNRYAIKLNNKTSEATSYEISLTGIDAEWEARPNKQISIPAEQSITIDIFVTMPMLASNTPPTEFSFHIAGQGPSHDIKLSHVSTFFWPKEKP